MSPNNASSANMVTPPESSVKVNNGIATGLVPILKELDIIVNANEQYVQMNVTLL